MINVAVIGIGRMGTFHTHVAAANSQVSLAALVNRSPLAADLSELAPQAYITDNYTDIISHVDAAIIATPTPTHFSIARDFLSAGKHVLIEKPVTLSYQEAEKLFSLAAQKSVTLHIGHVERYNPAFTALKKELAGQSTLIRTVRSGPFHPRVGHDSVVMDLMIHDIDLIMQLTGQAPISINAIGRRHVSAQPDTALANLTFDNGTIATISVHRGSSRSTRELVVEQESNTLTADLGSRTLTISTDGIDNVVEPPENVNPLALQLNAFITAIENGHYQRNTEHDLGVLHTTLIIAEQVDQHHPSTTSPSFAALNA